MKHKIGALLLALLLLAGCSPAAPAREDGLTIVATTYPIYLFACALTRDVDGVQVERLDTGNVSCLHDYTLSMRDMQKLEGADVLAVNGAGLEDFLEDALNTSDACVIDCSQGIELLESLSHDHDGHEDHDHGHWDPHYWMDPERAGQMVQNLEAELVRLDPDHGEQYTANCGEVAALLAARRELARELLQMYHPITGLVTFHDGFQYFAQACGLPLLASIEEEAGSEASAKEIVEITRLVREYEIPIIFTEVNGSDATAQAIARETGCRVGQLSMIMDGPDDSLDRYLNAMTDNVIAIVNGFAGREVIRREGEGAETEQPLAFREPSAARPVPICITPAAVPLAAEEPPELVNNLPADQLPREAAGLHELLLKDIWRDTLVPLVWDERADVTLYGVVVSDLPELDPGAHPWLGGCNTGGVVLRQGDRAEYFPLYWGDNAHWDKSPWMLVEDLDGDGAEEAAVCLDAGRGTGVSLEALYIFELDTFAYTALACSVPEISAEYDPEVHTVLLTSPEHSLKIETQEFGEPIEGIGIGTVVSYFCENGRIQYQASLDLTQDTLGYAAQVTGPVVWNGEGYQWGPASGLTALDL